MLISPLIFLSLCDSTHEHYIISPTFPTKKISLLTKTTLPPPPPAILHRPTSKKTTQCKIPQLPLSIYYQHPPKKSTLPHKSPPCHRKKFKDMALVQLIPYDIFSTAPLPPK